MILFLGGLEGSGRRHITRTFSGKYDFHIYSILDRMTRRYVREKSGLMREVVTEPKDDEGRLFLYRRVAGALPMLSKMHAHVIMTDTFHRAGPREYLFHEARKYFSDVAFVWAQSEEDNTKKRILSRMSTNTPLVRSTLRKKQWHEQEFEAFDDSIPVINYGLSVEEPVSQLYEVVRPYLR